MVEVIVSALFLPGSYVTGDIGFKASVIVGTGLMMRVAVPVPLG